MKIKSIALHHIRIPFIKPYHLSKAYGTITHANAVVFRVHTDQGIVGLGEADPMNPFTEETPSTVMAVTRDLMGPLALGEDPTHITTLEAKLDQGMRGNLTARGALSMALYDILGKAEGIPAHLLLGGACHRSLPILGGIGSGTPEEDAEAIDTLIEEGYRTVMIKMGSLPIREEIRRMKSANERFGERINIVVDANQGWSVPEAMAFIRGIRDFPPDLLEQPISREDLSGLKRIRQHLSCPLSADESLESIRDAACLIRKQAVDVFSVKVSKNGGPGKAKWIAQTAAAFGIRCLMNSMLEFGITQAASLQVGCTLTNLMDMGHAYGSVLRLADDVTDFRKYLSPSGVAVPSEPGLGVQVDEDKLKKYTVDYLKIEN